MNESTTKMEKLNSTAAIRRRKKEHEGDELEMGGTGWGFSYHCLGPWRMRWERSQENIATAQRLKKLSDIRSTGLHAKLTNDAN